MNPRAAAAQCLYQVIYRHRSLNDVLAQEHLGKLDDANTALLKDICFGSLRWHFVINIWLDHLLVKPLKKKDQDIECLTRIGLYQLGWQQTPSHAVVNETVKAARTLKKPWSKGLINGVLRSFLRDQDSLREILTTEAGYASPSWLKKRLKKAWPEHWRAILNASNHKAPMTLRVNLGRISRNDYLQQLKNQDMTATAHPDVESAVMLDKPQDVYRLPGFSEGDVSVQDAAAQMAAMLLDCQPGMRVLDACAAPGGKTGHLLESGENLDVIALDQDPKRLQKVTENLNRLKLEAQIIEADANRLADWYDGEPFDRILLDAPCSATGVIRRHPDIRILRKPDDIESLAEQQANLLDTLWSVLKPGGKMLYATCSILPPENAAQIEQFVAKHDDAHLIAIHENSIGLQIFPGDNDMDGFYYALLEKH